MSKDPYCVQGPRQRSRPPRNRRGWRRRRLENVVLYIADGAGRSDQVPLKSRYSIRRIACIRRTCWPWTWQTFKVTTSDQTTHNIHPYPNPMTGNIPWNQSQPPGAAPIEKSWKATECYSGAVQHPSLDARLVRRGERAVRDHRCERQLHHQQRAARKLHRDGVAGRFGHADAKSDRGRGRGGNCEFHLQGEVGTGSFASQLLHKINESPQLTLRRFGS
jgi:hypothetical protein